MFCFPHPTEEWTGLLIDKGTKIPFGRHLIKIHHTLMPFRNHICSNFFFGFGRIASRKGKFIRVF